MASRSLEIERRLRDPPQPVVVSDRYPKDFHHGWKFIAFGPDGKLYGRWGRLATCAHPIRKRMP